jgi:energy-coupling factor transporter ATP-binding protein EcfA2
METIRVAYIEQFTVAGLAGRDDRPVHRVLDRHINIFWGLNGSGKTSLLKILHAALRNEVDILDRVPFASAEVIFWSTAHGAKMRRTFSKGEGASPTSDRDPFDEEDTTMEQVGPNLWREVPVFQHGKGWESELLEGELPDATRLSAPYRHSYLPISRLNEVNSRRPGTNRVIDETYLDQHFAEQVRSRWQVYNSEALSSIRAIQQQGLASILAQLFGGGTGAAADVSPEQVPGDQAYNLVRSFLSEQGINLRFGQSEFLRRYDTQSDLRIVVATIEDVTREVDDALRPQREFQDVIHRLYSGGKELVLDTRRVRGSIEVHSRGESIPLQALSSGEKQLLRLMLETLAAEDDTVMIDEPELSMHVDWQQVLVASMRKINPDCQLLLATHSPEVMADVPGEFVFEL